MWKLAFLVFQVCSFIGCSSDDKESSKRLMRTEKAKRVARSEKVSSSQEFNVSNAEARRAGRVHRVIQSHFMHKSLSADAEAPIDCTWYDWTEWNPASCPATCGGGVRTSTRAKNGPENGGVECPNTDITVRYSVCDKQAPCPIPCEWSAWNEWNACSTTCEMGMQQRSRKRIHTLDTDCPGEFEQRKNCNVLVESVRGVIGIPCPRDCEVGSWTHWSTGCDRSCGGGSRARYRKKLSPQMNSGKECPHLHEYLGCNEHPCPNITDHEMVNETEDCSFLEKLQNLLNVASWKCPEITNTTSNSTTVTNTTNATAITDTTDTTE